MRPTLGVSLVVAISAALPEALEAQYFRSCHAPSEPRLPSGHYAERYEMESARDDVERYLEDLQEYQDCLSRNLRESESSAETVLADWNRAVDEYNSR